jgi:hypothetical protein
MTLTALNKLKRQLNSTVEVIFGGGKNSKSLRHEFSHPFAWCLFIEDKCTVGLGFSA